jgi:hypothetical protein
MEKILYHNHKKKQQFMSMELREIIRHFSNTGIYTTRIVKIKGVKKKISVRLINKNMLKKGMFGNTLVSWLETSSGWLEPSNGLQSTGIRPDVEIGLTAVDGCCSVGVGQT